MYVSTFHWLWSFWWAQYVFKNSVQKGNCVFFHLVLRGAMTPRFFTHCSVWLQPPFFTFSRLLPACNPPSLPLWDVADQHCCLARLNATSHDCFLLPLGTAAQPRPDCCCSGPRPLPVPHALPALQQFLPPLLHVPAVAPAHGTSLPAPAGPGPDCATCCCHWTDWKFYSLLFLSLTAV